MKPSKVCELAVQFYGKEEQILVFLGELIELKEAVASGNTASITEETADVLICLAQRCIIAGIDPNFDKVPTEDCSLEELIDHITLAEARRSQGREWRPLGLYFLWSYIQKMIKEYQIDQKDIDDIQKKKLSRLYRNIQSRIKC